MESVRRGGSRNKSCVLRFLGCPSRLSGDREARTRESRIFSTDRLPAACRIRRPAVHHRRSRGYMLERLKITHILILCGASSTDASATVTSTVVRAKYRSGDLKSSYGVGCTLIGLSCRDTHKFLVSLATATIMQAAALTQSSTFRAAADGL